MVNIRNKNVLVAVFYLILCVTFFTSFIFTFILIYSYTLHSDYNFVDHWINNKRIMNIILILIVPVLSSGYALSQIFLNIWLLCKKSRRALLFFGWTTVISTIISFASILIAQIYHDLFMDKIGFVRVFEDVQKLKNKYYVSVYFNLALFVAIVALSSLCLVVSKSVFMRIKQTSSKQTMIEVNKKSNILIDNDIKNNIRNKIYQDNPLLKMDVKVSNYHTSSKELVELDYNLVKILNSYIKTHPNEIQEELIKLYKEIYSSKNIFKLDVLMNIIYKQAIKIKPIHKYVKDAIATKMQDKFVPELQLEQFKTKIRPALEVRFKEDEEKFISSLNGWIDAIDKKLASFAK